MPGSNDKITPEEEQKIKDWLAQYKPGADAVCPICESTEWMIGRYLSQTLTIGYSQQTRFGGVSYPYVVLISKCGYTMFLNAVMMGIVTREPEQSEKKEEGKG